MTRPLTLQQRLEGCIVGGAIGDAWGSAYENLAEESNPTTYYWGKKKTPARHYWAITDDTQLTLATCEALAENDTVTPEILACYFLNYYQQRKLSGIGASTLKALLELEAGGHWSQIGRMGEYAAGNGAAMRIAPFAFARNISNNDIRDFCRITHRNDEAFIGALAVIIAIKEIISCQWGNEASLLASIIPQLPDTNVRDRLIEIDQLGNVTIENVAKLGNNGYVVNSIPFAIYAAAQIKVLDFETVLNQIIKSGGDTDTNASIAGQIMGSFTGIENIPWHLKQKLQELREYDWIKDIVGKCKHGTGLF